MKTRHWIGFIAVTSLLVACETTSYPPAPGASAEASPVASEQVLLDKAPVEVVPGPSKPIVLAEPRSAPATPETAPQTSTDSARRVNDLRMFVFTEPAGGQQAESRDGYEIRFSLFSDYAESTD